MTTLTGTIVTPDGDPATGVVVLQLAGEDGRALPTAFVGDETIVGASSTELDADDTPHDVPIELSMPRAGRDALIPPPVDGGAGSPVSSGSVAPLTTPSLGVLAAPANPPKSTRTGGVLFALLLMAGSAAAFALFKPGVPKPPPPEAAVPSEATEMGATEEPTIPQRAGDALVPESPEPEKATAPSEPPPAPVPPEPPPRSARATEPKAPAPRADLPKRATTTTVAATPTPAEPEPAITEFDKSAATKALSEMATEASACRKSGDPSGMATVSVTFAPSGRVTSAVLSGPPFAGTATGGCIASTFRRARVPAFTGTHVTVTKTVVIQ